MVVVALSKVAAQLIPTTDVVHYGNLTDARSTHGGRNLEKRGSKKEGTITMINATPYRWKRIYQHSYQLHADWPEWVDAGRSPLFTIFLGVEIIS